MVVAKRGQDDRILAVGINDRIHGDRGFDTCVFRGRRSQYVVIPLSADGSVVEVRMRASGMDWGLESRQDRAFEPKSRLALRGELSSPSRQSG